jgi:UDP-N-acetylglucosamine acyltransferase
MTFIHSTAIISPKAEIGADVSIGPYVVIEDNVFIGAGTTIGPHAVIHRYTKIGQRNRIHAHAVLGDLPQHLAYKGNETWLEIGDDNIIREMVTIHRALGEESSVTRIGSNCFLMGNSHIGHDCVVGDHVIITNNAAIGGHVEIGNRAIIGGMVGVHQFVRIGALAMVAACTMVRKDVLPYCMVGGDPVKHYRLNAVGLRRNGINGDSYRNLEKAYRRLRAGLSLDGIENTAEVDHWRLWLVDNSKRGISGFVKAGSE